MSSNFFFWKIMTSKIQNWDFLILNWEQMDLDTLIIQSFFHSESLAQWQSVRLVFWRSLVQTLAVPTIFFFDFWNFCTPNPRFAGSNPPVENEFLKFFVCMYFSHVFVYFDYSMEKKHEMRFQQFLKSV